MNISFTGKIPIAECKVENRLTKENIPVTFFEYDCKDMEDVNELQATRSLHTFRDSIARYMAIKTKKIQAKQKPDSERFYGIKTDNGEIIGIAQTKSDKNGVHIDFIETNFREYKDTGRNMLALIGKFGTRDEKNKRLIIDCYTDNAFDFYTKKCDFKPYDKGNKLALGPKGLRKLFQRAQTKSKSSFKEV